MWLLARSRSSPWWCWSRLELEDEGRRTDLCDALRAHTVPLSQADPPLENESFDDSAKRRTTLGIGDRRVVLGLAELGGLLHLTGEPDRPLASVFYRWAAFSDRLAVCSRG